MSKQDWLEDLVKTELGDPVDYVALITAIKSKLNEAIPDLIIGDTFGIEDSIRVGTHNETIEEIRSKLGL